MTSNSVIDGADMNPLGTRKPEVHDRVTVAAVGQICRAVATQLGLERAPQQLNEEPA